MTESLPLEVGWAGRSGSLGAAGARVLAGGADRDVGQLRGAMRDFRQATIASFNAMRNDLIDLRNHVDAGFAEVHGRLDGTAAGLAHITRLLTGLVAGGGDNAAGLG